MSTRGPSHGKRPAGQSTAGRHGEVTVEMTAQDVLSLAVNLAQNDWPLDGCDSTATRVMLDEIYGRILPAAQLAHLHLTPKPLQDDPYLLLGG